MSSQTAFHSGPLVFDSPSDKQNYSLAVSVAANALTVAFKTKAGTDPTSQDPITLNFRSSTLTSGVYVTRNITAALSVVIPSTTTIGTTSAVTTPIFVYLIDNAGTLEGALSLQPSFDEGSLITTVAISAGASATTLYSTTARTSVALRLIGRFISSQATAGTWVTAPTEITVSPIYTSKQFVLGTAVTSDSATTSNTFATPTNPVSVSITPQRTGIFKISGSFSVSNSTGGDQAAVQIIATTGSPTVLFSQTTLNNIATANYVQQSVAYTVVRLVKDTAYIFTVQMRRNSAGTATMYNSITGSGHILLAEEI